jgi:hypothetical protein
MTRTCRKITDLPLDVLLLVWKYLDKTFDYVDRSYFAAVIQDLDMIQHYYTISCRIACRNQIFYGVACGGYLKAVQWLHTHGCPWDEKTCWWAVRYGHLDVLQYLHTNGCPWNQNSCVQAARFGHLEVLQYLHTNGCPWDKWACHLAATYGHLEILEYLHTHGCPWNDDTFSRAVAWGQLEVLKYLHTHGCPWDKKKCLDVAKWNGQYHIVKWLSSI